MLVLVYFQRNSEGVFDFMEKGEEDHIIRLNRKFVDTMTRCQFCDSSFWMTWLALLNRFPSSVGQNIISSLQFYKSDFGIHHAIRMQIDSSNWSRKKSLQLCGGVGALFEYWINVQSIILALIRAQSIYIRYIKEWRPAGVVNVIVSRRPSARQSAGCDQYARKCDRRTKYCNYRFHCNKNNLDTTKFIRSKMERNTSAAIVVKRKTLYSLV